MDQKISRRQFFKSSVIAGTAFSLTSARSWAAGSVSKITNRPNILLIFADQQHWEAQGFKNSFFETPHQDKMAKKSVVFERAFCTTPQCSPSRSSMLTGFYPSATTVMGNVRAAGGNPLDQYTIGKELQDAGYHTGYFGKWHLGDIDAACAGWDKSEFKVDDPLAEKNSLDFLKNLNPDKPFALFVSINNPHDIYYYWKHEPETEIPEVPLPKSWKDETFKGKPPVQKQFMDEDQGKIIVDKPKENWQKYRDCYRSVNKLYDNNVGAVIGELKRQGKMEDTIIILTSDHGDMDAQHKLIYKGPFMYEHMVRIPFMVYVPEKFGGTTPRTIKDVDVVNVDIAPTIRQFCGLRNIQCHGKSLVPLLTGKGDYKPRDFVVSQYYSKQRWVNPIRMIRTKRFKLNRHIHWGDELYDLRNDPDELTNLAKDTKYADIKRDLAKKLDNWISEHQDPFYSLHVSNRRGGKI